MDEFKRGLLAAERIVSALRLGSQNRDSRDDQLLATAQKAIADFASDEYVWKLRDALGACEAQRA